MVVTGNEMKLPAYPEISNAFGIKRHGTGQTVSEFERTHLQIHSSATFTKFLLYFPWFWVSPEEKCHATLGRLMQGLPEEPAEKHNSFTKGQAFDERRHFS